MTALSAGAEDFARLARRLKAAGEVELRRELYSAISDAARPLAEEIRAFAHLAPYMPDRYAAVLAADIRVTTSRITSGNPGIRLVARGRAHRRKVVRLNEGFLTHPLFGDRDRWFTQTDGMKPGFFTDPCEHSGPHVRDEILAAMHDVASKVTGGP